MTTVGLLIIGDEILSGEIRDENGPFLLARLRDCGAHVAQVTTVRDDREAIRRELVRLLALADHVVISGGIGPTHDDVTRPAVADALGVSLVPHPEIEARLRGWHGEDVREAELAMALLPEGAELLAGTRTGTFGFRRDGVWVLPGVPALFRDIAETLPPRFGGSPACRAELACARREGEIAAALDLVQASCPRVAIGSYPELEDGTWRVRIVLRAENEADLAAAVAQVRRVL